jgi:predicted metal-dependent HD superfamily phosphohydrolase
MWPENPVYTVLTVSIDTNNAWLPTMLQKVRVNPGHFTSCLLPSFPMFEHERLSPEKMYVLQIGWVNLLGKFGVEPVAAYPVYDALIGLYAQPYRKYHTLEHVTEMLRVIGKLGANLSNLPAVQLAVWFHDAVYDPDSKNNEKASADLARAALEPLRIPANVLNDIERLILATQHTNTGIVAEDEAVLLDCDLAILGAEPGRYRRYSAAIRQEYAHVADDVYTSGRAAILQSFLARPKIYRTAAMAAEGESIARANIQAEIESLGCQNGML